MSHPSSPPPRLPEPYRVGCTNTTCVWGHPGGMATNGGCHCISDLRLPFDDRRLIEAGIRQLRRERDAALNRVGDLEAALEELLKNLPPTGWWKEVRERALMLMERTER